MKLERSANAKRNLAFGIINQGVITFLPFVLRTVIIYVIGSQYLGLDSLFSSILKVLSMTELGFSSAVVYSMYQPIAKNDMETLSALLCFFKRVYTWIGLIILGAGLLVLPWLPKLINGTYPSDINLYVLYLMFLGNTCISYFLFGYKSSLLSAYQRVDISKKVNMLVMASCYLIQMAVIFLTKNYYIYIAVMIAATVVSNFCTAYLTKKYFPNILPKGTLSREKKKDVMTKVKGLMIEKVCNTSRNAFDSIFMSAFLGLTQTAIYNNYYYISNGVTCFMTVLNVSVLAGIGNSIQLETEEKNYRDMNKINFIYMWMGGWFTTCLVCLYQPFTQLVWGEDMLFPFSIVILFCLYFYVLKMGDVRSIYASACGLWWENRVRAIVEAAANLILNYILGKYFGAFGIVLATLLSLFVFNFLWSSTVVFQYYFKHQKPSEFFISHLLYAVATLAGCVLTYLLCHYLPGPLWLQLVERGILCLIIPNVVYLIIYRRLKLYREAIPWILKVFKLSPKNPVCKILMPKN